MRRAARAPREPEMPPELERGEIAALSHDAGYSEIELVDSALTGQRAGGVKLETVRLTGVDLSGSRLEHPRIADGALDACNLANLHGRRATVSRVTINTSRLTGIVLTESALADVTVRGCRVDLASFRLSRLERVTFEDCLLGQTDFLEAQLDSVRFHGCDLTGTDFRGARVRSCEFRRSNLSGLLGVESLRGAAMEWPDIVEMAGVWAAALGIEVIDAD